MKFSAIRLMVPDGRLAHSFCLWLGLCLLLVIGVPGSAIAAKSHVRPAKKGLTRPVKKGHGIPVRKRQARRPVRTRTTVQKHKTVVTRKKTARKKYRPYILGGNIGYLYGFGDVKTPVVRLYGGYRFLVRGNDIALLAGAGWRTGSGNSRWQDPLLGSVHADWRVQAMPLFAGGSFRWHLFPKLVMDMGANLIGLYTRYVFSVTNSLGSISPESVTDSWAIGAELHTGLQFQAGPGLVSTTLRYSSIRQSNNVSPVSGELGGLALVAGYEWPF